MNVNRGKDFEGVVEKCFEKTPDTAVIRLHDQTTGFKGSTNICDYIVYHFPYMYLLECKSVNTPTFSIHSNDPKKKYGLITNHQWEGMFKCDKIKGVRAGVIIWYVKHDVTKYVPIATLQHLYDNDYKSIKYDFNDKCREFPTLDLVGVKKRVFFDYDMENFFRRVKNGEDCRIPYKVIP